MQIREQGKKIQCIRSVYDSTIKRSRQTVVASFSRWADKLPSAELTALTDEERAELSTWWAEYRRKGESSLMLYTVRNMARTLATQADALTAAATAVTELPALTVAQSDELWEQIARLQKALKKAGHPRPKRPAAPAGKPAALEGQGDLLSGE